MSDMPVQILIKQRPPVGDGLVGWGVVGGGGGKLTILVLKFEQAVFINQPGPKPEHFNN